MGYDNAGGVRDVIQDGRHLGFGKNSNLTENSEIANIFC